MNPTIDPVALTERLVQCESVTPDEGGAIMLLKELLESHNFKCQIIKRGGVTNLFARFGSEHPVIAFSGHTDVVPPGNLDEWTHPPFDAKIVDGELHGRGSVDMKSGVAAFVASAVKASKGAFQGSIVLMITGDEEGPSVDGTLAILDWMSEKGHKIDHCIVGEPTGVDIIGDMIKIGRRGSMTGKVIVRGIQGHVAYKERFNNPIGALAEVICRLNNLSLDTGTEFFEPSNLEFVIVGGGSATNVVPGEACATFNIRFNDAHTSESLKRMIQEEIDTVAKDFEREIQVDYKVSGESFVTQPGSFVNLVCEAVKDATDLEPTRSTSGGTSDARFIHHLCLEIVELGLAARGLLHQVNERVLVEEIVKLEEIYAQILSKYTRRFA